MTPALVIQAAGASARLGECKALARIGGTSVLLALLDAGAVLDATRPLLIAGADFEALSNAAPASCEVVLNPHWKSGRTSGVRLAHALRPAHDLCLAPVDVPLVPRAVFEQLVRAWIAAGTPASGWLAPRFGQRFGHPIVVGRALLAQLDSLAIDVPLRDLRALAEPLLSVAVDSPRVLDDLDTPEDLARLRNLFS